jgi:hypothetical protein
MQDDSIEPNAPINAETLSYRSIRIQTMFACVQPAVMRRTIPPMALLD